MDEFDIVTTDQRMIINFDQLGINGVLRLGKYNYLKVGKKLDTHAHEKMVEICYLEKGKQVYCIEDETFVMSGGDILITFPNEKHSTGDFYESKGKLYWLLVEKPREGLNFINYPDKYGLTIFNELLNIKKRQFHGSPKLKTTLNKIFKAYKSLENPLNSIKICNLLTRYLLDVIECSQAQKEFKTYDEILKTVQFIKLHIDQKLSLNDLANRIGLSLSHFKHKFKQEIGLTPAEYILRQKIKHSQKLLQQRDRTITEIAFELNFSSSQHFSTAFKRYIGISPQQYRTEDSN